MCVGYVDILDMDTEGTTLETGERPPISDDLKLVHLDPRLGCMHVNKRYPYP